MAMINLASATIQMLRALALSGDEAALDELLIRASQTKADVTTTRQPGRRGRKPGSGSFDALDEPLLDEMARLLSSGEVLPYVSFAAAHVVSKAAGHGTEENKRRRLIRKYEKSGRSVPDPKDSEWDGAGCPF